MKKVVQSKKDLLNSLSVLETDWKDEYAEKVISFFDHIDKMDFENGSSVLQELLDIDFDLASTVFRMFIGKSKDEYTSLLRSMFTEKGKSGKSYYAKNKNEYISTINHLLIREKKLETIGRE